MKEIGKYDTMAFTKNLITLKFFFSNRNNVLGEEKGLTFLLTKI